MIPSDVPDWWPAHFGHLVPFVDSFFPLTNSPQVCADYSFKACSNLYLNKRCSEKSDPQVKPDCELNSFLEVKGCHMHLPEDRKKTRVHQIIWGTQTSPAGISHQCVFRVFSYTASVLRWELGVVGRCRGSLTFCWGTAVDFFLVLTMLVIIWRGRESRGDMRTCRYKWHWI